MGQHLKALMSVGVEDCLIFCWIHVNLHYQVWNDIFILQDINYKLSIKMRLQMKILT
jgi:hypothetical protein